MFALALTALIPTSYALDDAQLNPPRLSESPMTEVAHVESDDVFADAFEAEFAVAEGRRRRPPVPWPDTSKVCRFRRTTKCKQGCPIGWREVGVANLGCCEGFASCGGHSKVCVKNFKCPNRRRSEHDYEDDMYEILSTVEIEILPTDEIEVLSGDVLEMTEAFSNDEFEIEATDADVSEAELSDAEGRRRGPQFQSGRRRGPGFGAAGGRRRSSTAQRRRSVCRTSLVTRCNQRCPSGYMEVRSTSFGCNVGERRLCRRSTPCPIRRLSDASQHGVDQPEVAAETIESQLPVAEGRRRAPGSQSGRRRSPGSMVGRRRSPSTAQRRRFMCRESLVTRCGQDCPSGYRTVRLTRSGCGARQTRKLCRRLRICPLRRRRISTPGSQTGRRRAPGSMVGRRRSPPAPSAQRRMSACRTRLATRCGQECPRGYRTVRSSRFGCSARQTRKLCQRVRPCDIRRRSGHYEQEHDGIETLSSDESEQIDEVLSAGDLEQIDEFLSAADVEEFERELFADDFEQMDDDLFADNMEQNDEDVSADDYEQIDDDDLFAEFERTEDLFAEDFDEVFFDDFEQMDGEDLDEVFDDFEQMDDYADDFEQIDEVLYADDFEQIDEVLYADDFEQIDEVLYADDFELMDEVLYADDFEEMDADLYVDDDEWMDAYLFADDYEELPSLVEDGYWMDLSDGSAEPVRASPFLGLADLLAEDEDSLEAETEAEDSRETSSVVVDSAEDEAEDSREASSVLAESSEDDEAAVEPTAQSQEFLEETTDVEVQDL